MDRHSRLHLVKKHGGHINISLLLGQGYTNDGMKKAADF